MRKPNFENYWGSGKTPKLQIGILKSIVSYGKLSITRVSNILHSNDSDVHDAIQLLKQRNFLEYSDSDTSSTNPEKFYKITEKGLKSLLVINGLSPEEFWKIVALICIVSKDQISQSQFEEYYIQFEKDYLGYSASNHFFQSWLFDKIIQVWLQGNDSDNISSVPVSQVVIECLALHRSLTHQQLIKETGLKKKDLNEILDKYSIPIGPYKEKVSTDSISRFLIIAKRTSTEVTYELSLFGVILAIAFIRYHYVSVDFILDPFHDKRKAKNSRFSLFYENKKMDEYYDIITYNYKEKLPIIFEKWSFLKSHLASLLYDSLDFVIYKKARSNIMNNSVWFGGNKEFCQDVHGIAQYSYPKLSIVHILGKGILQHYQDQYQYKLVPVSRKIIEIEQELFYANESYIGNKSHQSDLSIDYIHGIEDLFKDEVTFLFYLNLNSLAFSASIDYLSVRPGQLFKIQYRNELFQLGSPKQRLMAILTKDEDIKHWFSRQLRDIIDYRNQISMKMLGFYNEVINSQENIKKENINLQKSNIRPESEPQSQEFEYDITKICMESPYDY